MNRKTIFATLGVLALGVVGYSIFSPSTPRPSQGPPLVAVTVPALSVAEQAGEAKFNQFCASCHGKNAAGQDGVAPPFVHPIYKPGHHGDQAFILAATTGARAHHWPFGDMPPVKGVTSNDVQEIVVYVRALQRANGIM